MIGRANPKTFTNPRQESWIPWFRPFTPSTARASNARCSALQAQPPRVRPALQELKRVFTHSGANPPAILTACATLLNTDAAVSGDILAAVRNVHAEWDSYGDAERELFNQCVWSSETRRAVAVTEVNDVTVMLRETPPRVADALNGLRWLNAQTQYAHQAVFTVCGTLLKNPSADHPAIVEAIQTAHQLWPSLADDLRTLVMACVYASKARAAHARARTAARQQTTEAEPADVHRCGNCDGNLAGLPEMRYCSDACRTDAEAAERPTDSEHTTTVPAHRVAATHEPIEQRAARRYVDGDSRSPTTTSSGARWSRRSRPPVSCARTKAVSTPTKPSGSATATLTTPATSSAN